MQVVIYFGNCDSLVLSDVSEFGENRENLRDICVEIPFDKVNGYCNGLEGYVESYKVNDNNGSGYCNIYMTFKKDIETVTVLGIECYDY